jgi:hypothetical protein
MPADSNTNAMSDFFDSRKVETVHWFFLASGLCTSAYTTANEDITTERVHWLD